MNSDQKYDIIIIGSGLGGLISANILAKEGYKVLILEKGNKTGGLLHNFKREQTVFNTGMNYIGSLEPDGFLEQYFRYLGVMDQLSLKRLDLNSYEEISFSGDAANYHYAQTQTGLINSLSESFPNYHQQIKNHIHHLYKVSDQFPLLFLKNYDKIDKGSDYLNGGVWQSINSLKVSSKLKSVLGATNSLYGGTKEKTPFYIHALVNRQFINSAWRFVDGSQQLANALQEKIETYGGAVKHRSQVTRITSISEDEFHITTKDEQLFRASKVISNIHPAVTLNMLEDQRIKSVYKKRISDLNNTAGFFNLYLIFKKDCFPYLNRNYYHFASSEVWGHEKSTKNWPGYFMFYTGLEKQDQKFAKNATVLTYMDFLDVKKWENTKKAMRGDDYKAFKEEKAQKLLNLVEEKFPGIKNCIHSYYTATPLTYHHYIGSPSGSAYGIEKDYNNPYKSIILPKTKIPNLFFTGQNLNMHGALGVTIGAVLTSAEILGFNYLLDKIRKEVI